MIKVGRSSISEAVESNPENPKPLNAKKVSKEVDTAIARIGGEWFEGDSCEFNKGTSATKVAEAIVSQLRKAGYQVQFWTKSDIGTDKVTTEFSVEDPKNSYKSISYSISKDNENSNQDKVYFYISVENVY